MFQKEEIPQNRKKANIHSNHSPSTLLILPLNNTLFSVFSFNAFKICIRILHSKECYHMAKNKTILSALNQCDTKQLFIGDDRSLGFV